MTAKNYFLNRSPERSFNQLSLECSVINKRIFDSTKAKMEITFYKNLNNQLKPLKSYFPDFYGFTETAEWSEYSIEYINAPDLSTVYLQENLSNEKFQEILSLISDFFKKIPQVRTPKDSIQSTYKGLFIDRLETRFEQLKSKKVFSNIQPLLNFNLQSHFLRLTSLLEKNIQAKTEGLLYASHGDLCFSNMLYFDGILKFVDPRGALTYKELLIPLEYDLAKISQCVMGNYDGLLNCTKPKFSEQKNIFSKWIEDLGFELQQIRLYEACHLMSLIPLHLEDPQLYARFATASFEAVRNMP